MRKFGLIAATAVASLSVVGIAQAVDVNQGIDIKTTGKKGTKAKPSGLKLSTTTTTSGKDPSIDGTYGTKSAVVHFDKNIKFNNAKFPTCTLTTVSTKSENCPKGSKVGSGDSAAVAGPGGAVKNNPDIEAYNGKGGQLYLKLIAKPGEIDTGAVLTGTLKKDTGKFGSKLVVPIPAKLQNNLGLFVTINRFTVVIPKQTYKGKPYVYSVGCTGGKYNFKGDFVFTDNTKATALDTAKC